jgi:hypothetical protein
MIHQGSGFSHTAGWSDVPGAMGSHNVAGPGEILNNPAFYANEIRILCSVMHGFGLSAENNAKHFFLYEYFCLTFCHKPPLNYHH